MGLRNRFIFYLIILIAFIFYSCNGEKKIESSKIFFDDLGNKITLTKEVNRVISLAPNLTEIIYILDYGDKLVGVTRFCDFPEEVKRKEIIGDIISINFEKIVELKPDLVLMTVEGNTKETFDKLSSLGIKVFVTNPRNFSGIKKSIKDLATIFNKTSKADSILKEMDSRLNEVKKVSVRRKDGLFIISLNPLMVAGKNTFINEILESVNIQNIASKLEANYPVLSREDFLIQNPEILIISSFEKENLKEIIKSYPEWKQIEAIKNNNIVFVDENIFFRPGPRFILAVEFLSNKLKVFEKKSDKSH